MPIKKTSRDILREIELRVGLMASLDVPEEDGKQEWDTGRY